MTDLLESETVQHFAARLRFETDPSDVRAAQQAGDRFVLVDSRGDAAWAQGRAVGAVHLPTARIAAEAPGLLDPDVPVVVYCWGPAATARRRRRSSSPGSATRSGR